MTTRPIRGFCIATLVALTVGCAGGPSGSVTVEGALAGTNAGSATATPATLRLAHHLGASLRRVAEAPDPRIDDLQSMALKVTSVSGGPFRDNFVLAAVVEDSNPSEGAGAPFRYLGDDPDWVRRHQGKLALVSLSVGAGKAGQSATRTLASGPSQRAGAAWLVRLENNDPVIPWIIDEGDARCQAVSPSSSFVAPPMGQSRDCFDLGTLAGMVLAHVAKAVTEGLDDGPLPTLVAATRHELFIVPSLDQTNTLGGPGFGFIYSAELRIGERGGQTQATVHVPIGVHFRPDLAMVFEPLGAAPRSPLTAGRVTLAYQERGAGDGVAREIRALIVEILERTALPPITVDGKDVPAEQAIGRMVGAVAPQPATARPASSNLDVVALPVDRSSMEAPVPTLVLSLPRVSTSISTGGALNAWRAAPSARPQATARGDGSVTVTTPLDPPGRIRRVTSLSPARTGDPYELRILR